MGFDNMSMRSGHARLPTYIVAGLLLMSFLLMCNWWSLSSQNTELLRQMDEMGSQLSICSDERVICMSKRNTVEAQLRDAQGKASALESVHRDDIAKLKRQKADLEKSVSNIKQDLTFCKTEQEFLKKVNVSKEATLESLRIEKESLVSQLSVAKEKIQHLEDTVKKTNEMSVASIQKPMQSTESHKKIKEEVQDVLHEPSLNDGPVQGANHELNKEIETAVENAAEEFDENMEPETGRRPPLKE